MKFRNYCIVVMGNTSGAQSEIAKICEGDPNVLDAKGILIATFTSFAEPNELTAWFSENNRNFFVFDLDKENSGFYITKKEIHEGLFGFLKNVNTNEMNDNFLKSISLSSETKDVKTVKKPTRNSAKNNNKLDPKNIEKMSPTEKQDLLNELIDSGLENLTENDKKLLPLLAK
ncbi:MAG: hypothetical protein WCK82_07990 [Bacteroidota bacterium]|jgi:hypothetical protein